MPDTPVTAEDVYDAPDPRTALLDIARRAVGLSYAPATRDAYVAAIFPDEAPARGSQMASSMSSCGLLVRACWWLYGCQDARLHAPYVPGLVMADLENMALEAGAMRTPKSLGDLQPGDAVFIGGPYHVLLVEEVDREAEPDVVRSIDGGQKTDGRNYGVTRRVRSVVNGCLVSEGGTPRVVTGWIDWAAVAAKFG